MTWELFAALKVMTETPHIRVYLQQYDRTALRQAEAALQTARITCLRIVQS